MANNDFGRLQPVEYDQYPPSPKKASSETNQPDSPSKKAPGDRMMPKYGAEDLKKIGDDCENRLPPASAVQAMFLYERQRKTESEELFQGLMSRLAQEEAAAAEEKERVKDLEQRLTKFEKEAVRVSEAKNFVLKAHDEKLKALTTLFDHKLEAHSTIFDRKLEQAIAQLHKDQGDRHRAQVARVETLSEKLEKVTSQLLNLQTRVNTAGIAAASHRADKEARKKAKKAEAEAETAEQAEKAAKETEKEVVPASDAVVATIKQEIDVLFLDRDNILTMVKESKTRLTKAEENIRALTLQRAAPATPTTAAPHRLALTTTNGSQLDLGVPKGMGLKKENGSRKENTPLRSFASGK